MEDIDEKFEAYWESMLDKLKAQPDIMDNRCTGNVEALTRQVLKCDAEMGGHFAMIKNAQSEEEEHV